MKINANYFSLNSYFSKIRYFLNQGNVVEHFIDRFIWHIYPRLHIVSRFPKHLDIEVSGACQLNCPMCGRKAMKVETGLMDFGLYEKIIDQARKLNVYSVKLSWRGEPLLHPRFFEMVKLAKDNGIKDVSFLTNLGPLKNEEIENLLDSGCDWLSVSADGLGEIYEKIRSPLKFDETYGKVKAIKELREKRGLKKPLIRIQSIYSAISENPSEYWNKWSQVADKVNFIADQMRADKDHDFPRNPLFQCQCPWLRFFISYNGNVISCPPDYDEVSIMGNVSHSGLKDIWHGKKFNEFRKKHKEKRFMQDPPCNTCAHTGIKKEQVVNIAGREIKITTFVGQNFFDSAKNE